MTGSLGNSEFCFPGISMFDEFSRNKIQGVSVGRGSWVPSRGSRVRSRGSWVPSRGSWVPSRGSWVPSRGSWVVGHGLLIGRDLH